MSDMDRRRERIAESMRRAQRRLAFRTQEQIARECGMSVSTWQKRLREPGSLTLDELWRLEAVFRHAGMREEAERIGAIA